MSILSGQDFTAASDLQALVALVSKTGRSVVCTLHGRSMGRGLPDDTLICIHALRGDECQVGQLVVFDVNGTLVAHRVVYLGAGPRLGGFVLTHGDGRIPCDPPIERSAVLGVVTDYCCDGNWRPVDRRASRSALGRLRAMLHVTFIRTCMLFSVPMAQWMARTLLAVSSIQSFKHALRAGREGKVHHVHARRA
jgi:hypothetical protein